MHAPRGAAISHRQKGQHLHRVDDAEGWKTALSILKQAMDESGYPYKEVEGEAAFYGPKVDFMVKSVVGTEYAISTNQLDFMATKRFNLVYTAEDGSKQPVYVIHRAPMVAEEVQQFSENWCILAELHGIR